MDDIITMPLPRHIYFSSEVVVVAVGQQEHLSALSPLLSQPLLSPASSPVPHSTSPLPPVSHTLSHTLYHKLLLSLRLHTLSPPRASHNSNQDSRPFSAYQPPSSDSPTPISSVLSPRQLARLLVQLGALLGQVVLRVRARLVVFFDDEKLSGLGQHVLGLGSGRGWRRRGDRGLSGKIS